MQIREPYIINEVISFPEPDRPLTYIEESLARAFLQKHVAHPYHMRIQRLLTMLESIWKIALIGTDKAIQITLGDFIIDELIGTWGTLKLIEKKLNMEPLPLVQELGAIVVILVDMLGDLYYNGDSKNLRIWAKMLADSRGLPPLPKPVGQKKGNLRNFNHWVGEWATELSNQGYGWHEVAREMNQVIKTKKRRTGPEKELFKLLKNTPYAKLGAKMEQFSRRYRDSLTLQKYF